MGHTPGRVRPRDRVAAGDTVPLDDLHPTAVGYMPPNGLFQMDALIGDIVSDPGVEKLLAPATPIAAPTSLIKDALQLDSFESVTQEEIDSARGSPEIQEALAAMTGADTDGTAVAIANIHLATRATKEFRTLNGRSASWRPGMRVSCA